VVLDPRQVGKTTLIQNILKNKEYLFLNADDSSVRQIMQQPGTFDLKRIIGQNNIVFMDEAQRLPEVGLTLKLITDQFKRVQLIVSGSSALEISNQTNEPLTGRKWEYLLFPISWDELETSIGYIESEKQLEHRLIYGMYPDVINHPGKEKDVLQQLANSYLYKHILIWICLKRPSSSSVSVVLAAILEMKLKIIGKFIFGITASEISSLQISILLIFARIKALCGKTF